MQNQEPTAVPSGRPSITDVALRAGVSRAAVSKVIRHAYGVSPLMRERVERAIQELEYRPRTAARSMRGHSFTLGFEFPQIGNDFFTQVTRGISLRLEDSAYQLIVAPAIDGHRGSSVIDALVDRQVDGIIAVSPDVTPGRIESVAAQVPVVLLGRHATSTHYDTVSNDDVLGVRLVMAHLRALRHDRIAHLTIRPYLHDGDSLVPHVVRLREYLAFMQAHRLEPEVVYSVPTEPDAYRAAAELLATEHPPTALFAGNDTLAIGALRALADAGLSSADVSIVGYDGIDIAAHPLISLTTVDQRGEEMGAAAFDLLMERLRDGRTTATHRRITPSLRLGRSTTSRSSR